VNLAELVGTEYPLVRLLLLAVAVVNVAFGLVCDRCGGPRRILGAVTEPHAVRRLLVALGLAAEPPPAPVLPAACSPVGVVKRTVSSGSYSRHLL
jgi:hypothetical protein